MIYNVKKNVLKKFNNNKLKKIDIKNHTWYYFDDIININDPDHSNTLIDEKPYENTFSRYWY